MAKVATDTDQRILAIGGFVRDKLLGKSSPDIDFVAEKDGIIAARVAKDYLGLNPDHLTIYKTYGTALINYGGLELEFVGARKESYQPNSRNPEVTTGTLEDDQKRRDFTINALAVDVSDPERKIIDPFDGITDLKNAIIRTPLDPDATFADDPLRMMRAIRFACQLGFTIEDHTFLSIQNNAARIEIITPERIITEVNKFMLSPLPSRGWFYLDSAHLLPYILPELAIMKGTEKIAEYGHKDNFLHTLEVLDNLSKMSENLWLRWAALLHDIGKPKTKRFHKDTGWTFHGHEVVGERMVKPIFKRLKLPLDERMNYVKKMVRLHLRPIALTKEEVTDSAVRRLLFDAGDDIEDLLLLCHADITSKNEKKKKRYRQNFEYLKERLIEVEESDQIRNWQPPIDGQTIMSTFRIKPSRTVGDIKTAIREAILDGDIGNNYDEAYQYMIKVGEKMGLSVQS